MHSDGGGAAHRAAEGYWAGLRGATQARGSRKLRHLRITDTHGNKLEGVYLALTDAEARELRTA